MKISQQVIVKRWKPILEKYEKIQNKVLPRPFRLVKELCLAHYISNKELKFKYKQVMCNYALKGINYVITGV